MVSGHVANIVTLASLAYIYVAFAQNVQTQSLFAFDSGTSVLDGLPSVISHDGHTIDPSSSSNFFLPAAASVSILNTAQLEHRTLAKFSVH